MIILKPDRKPTRNQIAQGVAIYTQRQIIHIPKPIHKKIKDNVNLPNVFYSDLIKKTWRSYMNELISQMEGISSENRENGQE